MTPKEKAKNLVEKYAVWSWNETVCDYDVAKQCAVIAVEEILLALPDGSDYEFGLNQYWNEVKTEINNL